MFWFYFSLFIAAFLLGIFQAPIWLIIIVFLGIALISIFKQFYPVLFETDCEKVSAFLKQSKNQFYRFSYALLEGKNDEMEAELKKIRPKNQKLLGNVMLLCKQEKFSEAIPYLEQLPNNDYRKYYSAIVYLHLGDKEAYAQNKGPLKSPILQAWLSSVELEKKGRLSEAIAIVEQQIPSLKGLNLLTAVKYKNELLSKARI